MPKNELLQPIKGTRRTSESNNAVIACNDYLRMGTGRSLVGLLQKYTDIYQDKPPTTSLATLKAWSTKFDWSDRATEYDADYENIKNAERQAVMDYGLALDYDRVNRLKRLADFLEQQIYERGEDGDYPNVWLPDVKQIGSGEHAERVDIERFNASLISEFRNILDDLAKETGGRKQRTEVTGANGGAIIIQTGQSLDDL